MADRQSHRDEADPSRGEVDRLNFDHHREERHRLMGTSRTHHELTAHGFIDATDIECSVDEGDVTLSGFVDSPETKRSDAYVAEAIQGVHDVHNSLRIRSRQDAERVEAPNAPRPLESLSRTATRSGDTDARRSRARTK